MNSSGFPRVLSPLGPPGRRALSVSAAARPDVFIAFEHSLLLMQGCNSNVVEKHFVGAWTALPMSVMFRVRDHIVLALRALSTRTTAVMCLTVRVRARVHS